MKNNSIIFCLFLCLVTSSCSRYAVLPMPKNAQSSVKGSYLSYYNKHSVLVFGEIIAVSTDTLYLLNDPSYYNPKKEIKRISFTDLDKAIIHVARTSDIPDGLTTWGTLLPLTTLSHGFYLILSLPINLLIDIPIACTAQSATYQFRFPSQIAKDELFKFARFPQGLPQSISLNMVH